MSLLDGKYEVIRQHQAGPHRTVFEATAPEGTSLRIEWFDLPAELEDAFERYRRTLKRLKHTDRTALYDVTSRPGARYVAWERPPEGAGRGRDAEIEALLEAHGFTREDALLLRDHGEVRLFGLAFEDSAQAFGASVESGATPPPPSTARPAWLPAWGQPSPRIAAWGLAGLLLVASGLLAAFGFARRSNDRIVTITDLTGRPVNQATARLHDQGFRVTVVPAPSELAPGTVLGIEPPPGTHLRPGRTLRLTYALPAGQLPPTEVPRLVGEIFPGGVTRKLEEARLRLGTVARIAADVPRDTVIAQSALAGSALGESEVVDVLVSDGPHQASTFLPDLVGLELEDARYLARVAGIPADRVHVDTVASSGPPDRVLSQSLAAHRPIPRDRAILRLIVGRGGGAASAPNGMPSYVGMDRASALAAIGAVTVDIAVMETTSLPEGVVDQDPPPGAPPTDRVRLTVNVHPLEIPVPDIRVQVRDARLRSVPFSWTIEPGIPAVEAKVYATTLEGETTLVHSERVEGGETVSGAWLTTYPGVITFELELNGQPYSEPLRVP